MLGINRVIKPRPSRIGVHNQKKGRYYRVVLKLKGKSTTRQDEERNYPKGRSTTKNNGIALKPLTFRGKMVTGTRARRKHRPHKSDPSPGGSDNPTDFQGDIMPIENIKGDYF